MGRRYGVKMRPFDDNIALEQRFCHYKLYCFMLQKSN